MVKNLENVPGPRENQTVVKCRAQVQHHQGNPVDRERHDSHRILRAARLEHQEDQRRDRQTHPNAMGDCRENLVENLVTLSRMLPCDK